MTALTTTYIFVYKIKGPTQGLWGCHDF